MQKRRVAVVGATGIAGQQFLACLPDHPWFEITAFAASERSAGKPYLEAIRDPKSKAVQWWCEGFPTGELQAMVVQDAADFDASTVDIVFSAIESAPARELEPRWAESTPVISTASAHRMADDVPLLIPGINSDHCALVDVQRKKRNWKGFVVPIPNCTCTGLAITLKPLQVSFGLDTVLMTSLQAVSGAGRSGGVLALDIIDNVLPYIVDEEEKVQRETQKILGTLAGEGVTPAPVKITCTCTRVNVLDGHTESVFVSMGKPCSLEEVKEAMRSWDGGLGDLPSAPTHMITVHDDPFRPQPRLDRDTEDGMTTTVGRVRQDPALLNGIKYMLVSHNTKMGAAKGAILVAELLMREGHLA